MKRFLLSIIFLILSGILIFGAFFWRTRGPASVIVPPPPQTATEPTFSAVTLESIFDDQKLNLINTDPNKIITILATGDVVPGRSVNFQTTKFDDFTWSWKNVSDFTKNADLTYINFEVPLATNCQVTNEGMNFCGDLKQVQGLLSGGVDVANLANNHAGDHGASGIANTQKILEESGIGVIGTGQILYKEIKGVKFAFLGFNDVTSVVNPAPAIASAITSLVQEAKTKADVIIVGWHWGVEYTNQPNSRQQELAHLTIDAGADLILGNHPHWIQPVEIYKGKIVIYAHGNFIFDQMWSEKTMEGVIGKYTFYGKQLIDVDFTPIKIRDYGQAYLPDALESASILKELEKNSKI